MYKKFIPIMVLLFLIGGGIGYYMSSKASSESQAVSSTIEYEPVKVEETEASSGNDSDMELDELRETLNLSFRIINAMIHKDYAYLETVIDPSVTLNKEENTITFNEVDYTRELMESFDYNNFEFRGYKRDGKQILIILGVYNVSYEFKYVKGKTEQGNYLLKHILTN